MGYQEHRLLDSQQNTIYRIIQARGFRPSDFAWSTIRGSEFQGSVPTLIHVPTGSEFVFDMDSLGNHYASWSPGEQRPTD